MGGVMALDGRDGKTIWTRWTRHEVFSVNCQVGEVVGNPNVTDEN